MTPPKILFLLKRKHNSHTSTDKSYIGLSTGLYNSASFVHNMLVEQGISSDMVVVHDNNDIDREVTKHQPTHVIIEALWVVPDKFSVLKKLHPTVKWIIRLHSDIPFLANEGSAMDWIAEYSNFENIQIACNSPFLVTELQQILGIRNGWSTTEKDQHIIYLPNYYPPNFVLKILPRHANTIHIGCFGAIRPMKNHLLQAIAAIQFAEECGKTVHFHVNHGRIEGKGESAFKNLRHLFEQLSHTGHKLICHDWMPHHEFLSLCRKMDIGMQVSLSETFNIVAADLVSQGVPIVVSEEIPWATPLFSASSTDCQNIIKMLHRTHTFASLNVLLHIRALREYSRKVQHIWRSIFLPRALHETKERHTR